MVTLGEQVLPNFAITNLCLQAIIFLRWLFSYQQMIIYAYLYCVEAELYERQAQNTRLLEGHERFADIIGSYVMQVSVWK